MTTLGIDIAWARPTVAQIKATGAHWVARYFSTDTTKNLHASEVHDYTAAGLGIVTVWETTTGRARAGFAAGQADARAADAQRAGVGLPAGVPIHFAVDEDTAWSSVQAYFSGVASVLGKTRVGVYGGFHIIEGAAGAGYRFLWQTVAWSGGQWSAHATIQQRGGTTLAGGADFDHAMATDFGQYPRPVAPAPTPKPPAPAPAPAPKPAPQPVPAPALTEDDVYAYLPPIAANIDVDLPVEPAGTLAKPQGGARNGPLWLEGCPQGANGTVTYAEHTAKGWSKPTTIPVTLGKKFGLALPEDGSVDVVRVHSTVPLIAYIVGRQV